MNKEVMKQALEALEMCAVYAYAEGTMQRKHTAAIEALTEALAQPVQPERKLVWLTREDVELWGLPSLPTVYEFTKFIEAKLKEKNLGL